ncbi:MAG: serine/threonine-protein kinase, partial [Deltaproteobacteria bacterium]
MSDPIQPGQRVGRYVIEGHLGAGGMGQVFRAFDELLRRSVALKLLHAADPAEQSPRAHDALDRILREARMAAALDHPNVVSIFDVGSHEGVAFIVMEFVLGHSLRAVDLGATPIATRILWLADVARALGAAHRAGLVHRDIKPENVMVRTDGVVKVLDFGIARQSIERPERTSLANILAPQLEHVPEALRRTLAGTMDDGALVGTPGYMPPELMLAGLFDARSDQFSWGVMAYEMLAGKLPWSHPGEPAALLTASMYETPPALLEL